MSVVYVTTQGATVQRRSGQLVVFKESQILQNVPETYVEQIVLFGNAHLTTPVVAFCLEKRVRCRVSFCHGKLSRAAAW